MHEALATDWGLDLNHVEDMNRRTRNSMEFRRSDGKKLSLLVSNLHYQAAPGEWEPQNLNFQLHGANHDADRLGFHTRVTDSGIETLNPDTGVGLRWLTGTRPSVTGRQAQLTGDGVIWRWEVGPRRLKLVGLVSTPLGVRTHEFQYQPLGAGQDFQIVNGAAISPGVVVAAPLIIGADGSFYPTSGWTLLTDRLTFTFDDRSLPPEAYPYTIDPTTELQPGSGGFDNYAASDVPNEQIGNSTAFDVGDSRNGGNRAQIAMLKFNVSSIASNTTIDDVTISLYERDGADSSGLGSWAVNFHRFLRNWVETEATWNIYSTGNNWGTAGANNSSTDYNSTLSATLTLDGTIANAFLDWNATQLTTDVQNFVDGGQSNYGWRISAPTADNRGAANSFSSFSSSDHGTASQRPKLVALYGPYFTPRAMMF